MGSQGAEGTSASLGPAQEAEQRSPGGRVWLRGGPCRDQRLPPPPPPCSRPAPLLAVEDEVTAQEGGGQAPSLSCPFPQPSWAPPFTGRARGASVPGLAQPLPRAAEGHVAGWAGPVPGVVQHPDALTPELTAAPSPPPPGPQNPTQGRRTPCSPPQASPAFSHHWGSRRRTPRGGRPESCLLKGPCL